MELSFPHTHYNKTTEDEVNNESNRKLVPWLSWDEWDTTRLSLLSPPSPLHLSDALRRVATWRSRGCLPVPVDVTASIVEIHHKDPHFREGESGGAVETEEMLAMLYGMAIVRFLNGTIEYKGKKTKKPLSVVAADIGLPPMLVEIRNDCSHRTLPSLQLLRLASVKALDWLKCYYWDRQKNAIPYHRSRSANVGEEIRSRLRNLAFSLKCKKRSGESSLGKRAKHHEQFMGATVHGRSKMFSLMACKSQSSKHVDSKKQAMKCLKKLVRLYSFFSSDVVSVLLEFLLKTSNSENSVDSPDSFQFNLSLKAAKALFDEWRPAIAKFSEQEPDLLLSLLKAVLDMIESRKVLRDTFGGEVFSLLQFDLENERVQVLSSLFSWLVPLLKGLKSPHTDGEHREIEAASALKPMLVDLMRRCLHLSDSENQELLSSGLLLAKMVDSSYLKEKLQKLSMLTSSDTTLTEVMHVDELINQEKLIRKAAQKLELLKLRKAESLRALRNKDGSVDDVNIWTVVKSWNPCPIGMLPRSVGSSGYIPILDASTDNEDKASLNSMNKNEIGETKCCRKREANTDGETMDPSVKRMKVTENDLRLTDNDPCVTENFDFSVADDANKCVMSDGLKGHLWIGGVWQAVGSDELQDIKSKVRVMVAGRVC